MKHRRTVIFLDYFESLERVAPLVHRICSRFKEKPVVVSSNFDHSPLNKYSNFELVYFEEFLSKEDFVFMEQFVFDLTHRWYAGLRNNERLGKTRQYLDIEFGFLAEHKIQPFFAFMVKKLEIALKIIEYYKPTHMILIGEPCIFKELSELIKEDIGISSAFVNCKEERFSIKRAFKKLRYFASEIASDTFDFFMRFIVTRRKLTGCEVFIDNRLYFKSKDLAKQFQTFVYVIGKSLQIRLKLIKEKKVFAPILVDDMVKIPDIFSSFYWNWRLIERDKKFQDNFRYRNVLIWKIMKRAIKELIIIDFPKIRKNIIFLQKLYNVITPKMVVLREAVRTPEKTIVYTAREKSVLTLVAQHGILAASGVYTAIHSNKIALWGRVGIEWYRGHNNDVSKCVVTGNPDHDFWYFEKNGEKDKVKSMLAKIGINQGRDIIAYLPGYFKLNRRLDLSVYHSQDSEFISLESVLNVARYFPDKCLIIKIHPYDTIDINFLRNYRVKYYPNVFIVKNEIDTINLIRESSLVVTSLFSSAGIDAVILKKPLITLNLYNKEDFAPFARRDVAVSVNKTEALLEAVNQIFIDGKIKEIMSINRDAFIYDYVYKIDGNSTKRLWELIKGSIYEQIEK